MPRRVPGYELTGPPELPKTPPLLVGPADDKSTVPCVLAQVPGLPLTEQLLFESTCMLLLGPPLILISVVVPLRLNDPFEDGSRTRIGIGDFRSTIAAVPFALTFDAVGPRRLINVVGTLRVTVTWISFTGSLPLKLGQFELPAPQTGSVTPGLVL